MAIENRLIDEIEVPVGMTEEYFGAQEDNELPVMGNAQMIASMVLSKFTVIQIKNMFPAMKNVPNKIFTTMVNDTCSRKIRKDFIKSLDGQMPRQLTVSEYVNAVKSVGLPNSKARMDNLDKVLRKIKIDMENFDLIVPARNPRTAAVVSKEDVETKIDKVSRSILRSETQIKAISKKLSAAQGTLVENSEDEAANYMVTKMNFALEDAEKMLKEKTVKLENLKEVLATFSVHE